MIVPQLNGIIAEIMKKPGDLVKAGDIIARIKVVPEMGSVNQAESQVEIAKIALDEAQQKYKIATELHQQGIVAEEEYATTKANYLQAKERLASAKDAYNIVLTGMSQRNAQGSTTLVRSTVDGTILDIPVKEGNSVIQANSFNAGTTIATIADMTEMIFIGKLDEVDIDYPSRCASERSRVPPSRESSSTSRPRRSSSSKARSTSSRPPSPSTTTVAYAPI